MGLPEWVRGAGFRDGSRRSFALLGALALLYVVGVGWILGSGWVRIMASSPVRPEAIALYMTLVLMTALPLALRFLYSRFLVEHLRHATHVMRQARDAARDAARTKAEFLATMSHEIRTPLNAVLGFTELLGEVSVTPRQREYANAIRESSSHLYSVVNDVLDYSKIEAGRIELEEKPVTVTSLVESCLRTVLLKVAKGVELASDIRPGTPAVLFADATRIRQIILNLLSNALKFTQQGEVRLVAGGQREPDGRYLVSFEVRDTGAGISAADQKRLFKGFTQVGAPPDGFREGTGLGLAISHRLCALMGGTLRVTSRPGHGSSFVATIRVPAGDALQGTTLRTRLLRGLRLLVVDANPASRSLIVHNAQAWGMVPRSTADPAKAMEWVHAGDPFDVAIVSEDRPKIDATHLAEQMWVAGRTTLPLVLFSAGPRRQRGTVPRPFAARIAKPVLAADLLAALEAAVQCGPKRRPLAVRRRPTRGLRILVVEDNPMNRMLTLRVLEGLGYKPNLASNGAEAVDAVLRKRYDVVFMDVQMPVMGGLEATRIIYRKVAHHDRPLIVGLSANALPGDREQCLRAGMDEYIAKPMEHGRIAALLGAVHKRGLPEPKDQTAKVTRTAEARGARRA